MTYIDPNMPLKDLVKLQRKAYKKFVTVRYPLLHIDVQFTFDGFEHLHMHGRNRRRGEKDARKRLFLMEHAPNVISQAKMMKRDVKKPEETHAGKRIIYHELYCKVGMNQTMVVVTVRKVGNGATHFFGIRYKQNKKKTTTK